MKKKQIFTFILFAGMLAVHISPAQVSSVYNLPDSYHFDYEVTQVLVHKKITTDTTDMHFFYTKNGDYAAAMINGKGNLKGNLFVVLTRDANTIIFDEHSKTITVISVGKLMSELSGAAKWIGMDSLVASLRKKTDGRQFKSVKTGHTRQVYNYTSEEYIVSDSMGHKAAVWCTKVDFSTLPEYILGAAGGNLLKMISGHMTDHPLFQVLAQPKTLVTAIDLRDSADHKEMELHTAGIRQITTTIPTSGYRINNYSNMTLQEIFQAEMRRRNN